MLLVDLVNYFRNKGSFESFCKERSLNSESEVIEVYMLKPFSLDSEINFFEIEKTEGKIEFVYEGIKYYNLFDFYYFLDTINDVFNDENLKSLSDTELATRILSYVIKDA